MSKSVKRNGIKADIEKLIIHIGRKIVKLSDQSDNNECEIFNQKFKNDPLGYNKCNFNRI